MDANCGDTGAAGLWGTPMPGSVSSAACWFVAERVDPERLLQYEQATGIALARGNVDSSGFQTASVTQAGRSGNNCDPTVPSMHPENGIPQQLLFTDDTHDG